jgi:hypothetical protein
MAVRGGVCPAILSADRQLLLHAAQGREHSDRRWQIRHASCKALAARDKEPAPNPWPLSNRPSHAYEGKPKSATLSLSPPRARSGLKKGCFLQIFGTFTSYFRRSQHEHNLPPDNGSFANSNRLRFAGDTMKLEKLISELAKCEHMKELAPTYHYKGWQRDCTKRSQQFEC